MTTPWMWASLTVHGYLPVANEDGGDDFVIEGGTSSASMSLNGASSGAARFTRIRFAKNSTTRWIIDYAGTAQTNVVFKRRSGGSWYSELNVDFTDGRVGVGTTAPADKLHVNGDAQVSGIMRALPAGDFSMGSYTNDANKP